MVTTTNNSWSWTGRRSYFLEQVIKRQQEAGMLFVAAAGNDNGDKDAYVDLEFHSNFSEIS